ncbi:hypothetical protein M9R32_12900 [Paenisporosarcina quisquiliarum]|uniref:Tetratricopeptide repeat-containing protein n=1 Tax=Paenisporosarcina quisquiliarum TaxID=365346 RepID=A0A9X3LHG8_9BACL|nr:hypothetical protein [Paenisporosarcina quisquiliarum]MCZ8538087.1 hypothetical protein [Paenisporosarcina quisquiliarum]
MNFKYLAIMYSLVFIVTLVLAFLEYPFWLIMLIVFAAVILPFSFMQLNAVYWTNDLKKIEKFLQANHKKPIMAFPLALAQGNRTEVVESVHAILAKHRMPIIQQVYSTILDLINRDYDAARASAEKISKAPLRAYYLAYVAAKQGDNEEAKRYMDSFDKPWMTHAMNSFLIKNEGNLKLAEEEHQKAIDTSRGIQKYMVVHSHKHL